MRRLVILIALAALAAAGYGGAGLGGSGGGGARGATVVAPATTTPARVGRVVDGDTVVATLDDGREERVRYIGVDTPESVKPDAPVECFAQRAAAANRELVDGRRVRLVTDAEARDRYGRLLAYVFRVSDGLFVNAQLLRGGFARTLTIAPNDAHAATFRRLAESARRDGRGLWSACRR